MGDRRYPNDSLVQFPVLPHSPVPRMRCPVKTSITRGRLEADLQFERALARGADYAWPLERLAFAVVEYPGRVATAAYLAVLAWVRPEALGPLLDGVTGPLRDRRAVQGRAMNQSTAGPR